MAVFEPPRETTRLRNAVVARLNADHSVDIAMDGGILSGVPVYGSMPWPGARILVCEQGASLIALGSGGSAEVGPGEVVVGALPSAAVLSEDGVTTLGTEAEYQSLVLWVDTDADTPGGGGSGSALGVTVDATFLNGEASVPLPAGAGGAVVAGFTFEVGPGVGIAASITGGMVRLRSSCEDAAYPVTLIFVGG